MGTQKNQEKRPFALEIDDKCDEDSVQDKGKLVKEFSASACEKDKCPMDSEYHEDEGETSSKIKINRNFIKGIRGLTDEEATDKDKDKFDIKRLFSAVSSGDVAQLEGLEEYLRRSMKHLTDSEYQSQGKNALLKALLNLKDGRNDTVKLLLDIAERMGDLREFVNAAYTDSYYKGQTALHVAIERRSKYFVELLVEKGADVHAKASGKFFQQHGGACFYFGEQPLSLAACTNQRDIVDFLLENQYQTVDVLEGDSRGNMVLHALVAVADNSSENTDFITKMYDHILTKAAKLHPKVNVEEIENKQGLTPIKLAAKTGKIELFKHMLHREFQDQENRHLSRKFTEWAYGPVYSSLYDLSSLDSYKKNSVLEIIVYGTNIPNRLKMLRVEPLNQLLEEKWRRFAHPIFLFSFMMYFMYLAIFSTMAYFWHDATELNITRLPPFPLEHELEGYLLLSGKVILLLGSVYFFFHGISDLRKTHAVLDTFLVDGFCEILFFIQAVLFMVSVGLYFGNRKEYLGCIVLCLALAWVNLLYYFRGSKDMGVYTVMIQKMILGDILHFCVVYMVFLLGFSAAIFTLLDHPPTRSAGTSRSPICKKLGPRNFTATILELFKFTIGMGDLEFTEDHNFKEVFYVLLISYIVLTYILLLNMLIALMNKTVQKTSEESADIWRLQRAITILDIERYLPWFLKRRLRSGVEKDLGKGDREDRRWCFRVEEVNWNKWNVCMGLISEDPGNQEFWMPTLHQRRGKTLRGILRRHRQGQRQADPMSPPPPSHV